MTGLAKDNKAPLSEGSLRVREEFSRRKFVLYVSSIDIRKNHRILIDVWRRLIEERGHNAPHLVFVGRPYWGGDEIMGGVVAEKGLSDRVHFLTNVSDDDLDWFYKNCAFTVYPSLYEGWGLPVVEALSYGKVCIASNRSSTAEIAPKLTDLIDPYDFVGWRNKIALYIDNPAALAQKEALIRAEFEEVSWSEASAQIMERIEHLPHADLRAPLLWSNSSFKFTEGVRDCGADQIATAGWGRAERSGRWMVGDRALLHFIPRGELERDVFVRFTMFASVRDAETPRELIVCVNGQEIKHLQVSGIREDFDIEIPSRARKNSDSEGSITIELHTPDVFSPKSNGTSSDGRQLGVALSEVRVADSLRGLSTLGNEENINQIQTANPDPSVTSHNRGSAQSRLEIALDRTFTPRRLPNTKPIYRLLRVFYLDFIFLALYNKLFGRTNDSIRRVIDVILNPKN